MSEIDPAREMHHLVMLEVVPENKGKVLAVKFSDLGFSDWSVQITHECTQYWR